jgi:predicted metalloprotease with PDZ domain
VTPPVDRANALRTVSLALAGSAAPLAAQRAETVRRAPRALVTDSLEAQMRRMQRAADSMSSLFYDEDLSASERRRVGAELDRMMEQYRVQTVQMAQLGAMRETRPFVRARVGPITGATSSSNMANALTEAIAREATPRGWIGIVLTGAATEARVERGELILHYFSYPLIASVDPSSPAQRAGLAPNDTLIAYNGRDVRDTDISMTRLLQPDAKLMVRIRRDGRVRELPVIVAATPTRIKQRRDDEIRDARSAFVLSGIPDAPMFPRMPAPGPGSVGVPRTIRPPMRVSAATALPPLPPSIAFVTNGIAGAQMVTVTEALAKSVNLPSGVLVANAPAGSPAAESGLRDGDVIVKAELQPVRSVADLRELIGQAAEGGERSVVLETVREKRTRKVTLRW